MADVGRKGQELQGTQSRQDIVTLMSTGKSFLARLSYFSLMCRGILVDEYARLINSVRVSNVMTYPVMAWPYSWVDSARL